MTEPVATVPPQGRHLPIRVAGALACAAALAGGWMVLRPDLMVVERVEFTGHHRATPAALRHLADIENGTTIWGVDLAAAMHGVERHPWVRTAHARRSGLDTVVIAVEERVPAALLHRDGAWYLDADGVAFARAEAHDLDYPSITGLDLHTDAHPDLPAVVVRDALWLADELDARGLVARGHLSEVEFSPTRGFTAHVDQTRIVFGPRDLPRQLGRLGVLTSEGLQLGPPQHVDLAPATVAIVRPLSPGGEG